jgi:hypothetical protein
MTTVERGRLTILQVTTKGLTAKQWLVIAFLILLAAVIAWEVVQDFNLDERLLRSS